jgi:hypothetical protein
MVTVSLDSPSCEVTLFDPESVVYRDATRQTKGLYSLKYVGALWRGLACLSRYNSGWFCHTEAPRLLPRHPPSPQTTEHQPPLPSVRTRRPPHRRAPPSALSPTELGTGKASPHSCDAHARPSGPCSPTPLRDHEHPNMATAIHRRRPCSVACLGAHHPPVNSVDHVGHIGPDHPRPNPRRQREHAGKTPRPPS